MVKNWIQEEDEVEGDGRDLWVGGEGQQFYPGPWVQNV